MAIGPTSSDPYLPESPLEFPEGFLWGAACASHQVEGGNWNNDWWEWEHTPGSACVEPSGDACDYWNRYGEDLDLLARLGEGSIHRFSLEWSRIEPEEGEFSRVALEHYRRLCDAVVEGGLVPMVTFHHFSTPRWAARDGSWTNPAMADRLARFAEKAAAALGPDRLPWVCTVNEPGIVAMLGYVLAVFPPGERDLGAQAQVTANMVRAHARVLEAVKSVVPGARSGICLAFSDTVPHDPGDAASVEFARGVRWVMEDVYVQALSTGEVTGLAGVEDFAVDGVVGTSDYVGLQYYQRSVLDPASPVFTVAEPPESEITLMGYASYPPGLANVLRRVAGADLPVVITENGMATDDDRRRCAWIAAHLNVAHQTMTAGDVDLRGYLYWSATDNFEWALGYGPTFGLIGIDFEGDLARRPRPSLDFLGEIARTGRLEPALVDRHVNAGRRPARAVDD